MPHFKQLAEGEQPANLEKFILIEVIREPAIGYQQSDRKRLGSGLPTVRRFHGLHAGKRARTRSGIGQGCVLANHLPEQWHRPNGDVIPVRLGSVHDPLLGTELDQIGTRGQEKAEVYPTEQNALTKWRFAQII
jgi:hypothetical protein